jgi:hypothetical protein
MHVTFGVYFAKLFDCHTFLQFFVLCNELCHM